MSDYGYIFYFQNGSDLITLPITPGELKISSGSKNKVITLISEGDINILKSPSLTEIEFEARFPMRKYPFSREPLTFEEYLSKFEAIKTKKIPVRFIVARSTPRGDRTWSTNMLVSLEEVELVENADEGDDVLVSFKLKQYREYNVKQIKIPSANPDTTSTSDTPRSDDNRTGETKTHRVESGDTLWAIAKYYYGDGSKYTLIYNANADTLNAVAQQHGKESSSNGHWIYPGTELVIPPLDGSNGDVQTVHNDGDVPGTPTSTVPKGYMVSILNKLPSDKSVVTLTYVRNGEKGVVAQRGSINQLVDAGTQITVDITYSNYDKPADNRFYVQSGSNETRALNGRYNTTRTVNTHLNFVASLNSRNGS